MENTLKYINIWKAKMKNKILDLILKSMGLLEVAKDSAKYNDYENIAYIVDEIIQKQEQLLDLADNL